MKSLFRFTKIVVACKLVLSLIWNYVLKFIVFFVTYLRWISIFDELRVAIILNLSKMLDFRSNLSVGINDSLNFKSVEEKSRMWLSNTNAAAMH